MLALGLGGDWVYSEAGWELWGGGGSNIEKKGKNIGGNGGKDNHRLVFKKNKGEERRGGGTGVGGKNACKFVLSNGRTDLTAIFALRMAGDTKARGGGTMHDRNYHVN